MSTNNEFGSGRVAAAPVTVSINAGLRPLPESVILALAERLGQGDDSVQISLGGSISSVINLVGKLNDRAQKVSAVLTLKGSKSAR